jgi:hypothetical protein
MRDWDDGVSGMLGAVATGPWFGNWQRCFVWDGNTKEF